MTDLIEDVIVREGGYVDNSADGGGPTKYGITQATLAAWRMRENYTRAREAADSVTAQDVQDLQMPEARLIYEAQYLNAPGLYRITDPTLQGLLFDSAVQHGPETAVRWLQAAVSVPIDGACGPVTAAAANANPARAYRQVLATRVRYYGAIISNNHSQAVFAAGWANRVSGFIEMSP